MLMILWGSKCSQGQGRETLSRALPSAKGQDLESSALEHSPRGRVPLDSHLLGVMGASLYRLITPCLAVTSRKDDRPPTHFFVKKKFIPIGGAETATQKVPSVFCYARDFL